MLEAMVAQYKPDAKASGGSASGGIENEGGEAGGSVEAYFVDVTDKESIRKLGEKVDKCHVLFNCAGYEHTHTHTNHTIYKQKHPDGSIL